MYKTLLHLVSASAHEIVTRKKLSQQYRDAASTIADALKLLLVGKDDLAGVKRLLDQADVKLSRSSDDLDRARELLDGALADASGKADAGAKPRATSGKVAGKKTAAKKMAGKKTAAKKVVGKKTAGKTRAAVAQATAKKTAAKKTATKKVGSKKIAAKKAGSKKTAVKKVATRKKAAGGKRTART